MLQSKLTILGSAELKQIHQATLAILSEADVRVEHPRMVEMLLKDGCRQGTTSDAVRFPKEVVKNI